VALDRASQVHVVERSGATRHTRVPPRRPVRSCSRAIALRYGGRRDRGARRDHRRTRVHDRSGGGSGLDRDVPDGGALAAVTRTGECCGASPKGTPRRSRAFTRDRAPDVLALRLDAHRVAAAPTPRSSYGADILRSACTFRSPHCHVRGTDASRRWLARSCGRGAARPRHGPRTHHATLETFAGVVRTVAIRGTLAACLRFRPAGSRSGIASGARLGEWSDDHVSHPSARRRHASHARVKAGSCSCASVRLHADRRRAGLGRPRAQRGRRSTVARSRASS
jgi:hypothetical protein